MKTGFTPIPVDEYRREMIQRVLQEAHNLKEFRQLWVETQKRRQLINHLLQLADVDLGRIHHRSGARFTSL